MSYVADDAKFILHDVHIVKAQVRGFYDGELARNSHWKLIDIKAERDTVTWNTHVTSDLGGSDNSEEPLVQGGKIVENFGWFVAQAWPRAVAIRCAVLKLTADRIREQAAG